MIKLKEIAWLAGIIEGEGSFHYAKSNSPMIVIKMTDKDVIERIASLFKRRVSEYPPRDSQCKVGYTTMICGTPAIEWLFTIYSFLGYRRRQKALELIDKWKASQSKFRRDTFKCGCPKTSENSYRNGRRSSCRACNLAQQKRRKHGDGRLSQVILTPFSIEEAGT